MLPKKFRRIQLSYQNSWAAWIGPTLLLLLLLASLILGWLMRDAVQDLVNTFAFSVWGLGLYLRRLPEEEIWLLLMLIALAQLTFGWSKQFTLPTPEPLSYHQNGTVNSWLETLKLNNNSAEMGRIPLRRLQHITLSVLSQQSHQPLSELRTKLWAGQLDMEPTLQTFLQTGRSTTSRSANIVSAPAQTSIAGSPEMEALLDLLERTS